MYSLCVSKSMIKIFSFLSPLEKKLSNRTQSSDRLTSGDVTQHYQARCVTEELPVTEVYLKIKFISYLEANKNTVQTDSQKRALHSLPISRYLNLKIIYIIRIKVI